MRTLRLTLLLGMLFTTFNLLAQSTPQKSFDVMKSLAGNWEGKTTMGDPVSVSYRLTSGGSALMSEIQTEMKGQSEDMITINDGLIELVERGVVSFETAHPHFDDLDKRAALQRRYFRVTPVREAGATRGA